MSLSFYKKLEGGRALSTHLRNLIQVAQALSAGDSDRASLIRLARPDLARMLPPEGERASIEASLRSLRTLASELLRTKGPHQALRIAVELLYASLEPDWMALGFERRATGHTTMRIAIGEHLHGIAWNGAGIPTHFPAGGPHVVECDDARIVYAPIRDRGHVVAILGVASDLERSLDQKGTLFLEIVAAMLEMRLGGQPPRDPG